MIYCIYHIPNKKIGVTNDLKNRVEKQQGYREGEYEVLEMSEDIDYISQREIELQKKYGYRVDRKLYKDLYNNNFKQLNNMNINITEMTTTFPCPINKLKGQLMDNIGMTWETEAGGVLITKDSIKWILNNVKSSQYTSDRCYVYNKAFARWFDNNKVDTSCNTECDDCGDEIFNCIREWADERGLYEKGDTKTQYIKLMEETGEIGRAILKNDTEQIIDGIGDAVVVLTNLAELVGVPIEECIQSAYDVIKYRTGKMDNGTFKKD